MKIMAKYQRMKAKWRNRNGGNINNGMA